MSKQVQCPNCGGYITNKFKTYTIDKDTGEYIRNGVFPLVVTLIIVFICFPVFIGNDMGASLLIIFGMIGILTGFFAFMDIKKIRETDVAFITEYRCQLCGYEWGQRSDEEPPKANTRPELIAKGAARLKRLEEERRKQEEERQRNED